MSLNGPPEASRISAIVGQAACGLVHDLANLIQTIILRAEVTAATEPVSAAAIKRMEQIVEDGQTGANLVRSLLEYARLSVADLPVLNLYAEVEKIFPLLSGATGKEWSFSAKGAPLASRVDASQLLDLLILSAQELSAEAEPGASFSLTVEIADVQGDGSLTWLADGTWALVKLSRLGRGRHPEIDEGHLVKALTGISPDTALMNALRIRGIMRQHKGQLRVSEEVEDTRHYCAVELFLPLTAES